MRENKDLRLHVINVGHGDAMIIEFPDRVSRSTGERRVRMAMVDAGGKSKSVAERKILGYLKSFLKYRMEGEAPRVDFEFICLTHPHTDHFSGMQAVLQWTLDQGMPPREAWDCGFRYNTGEYLDLLRRLHENRDSIRFSRVSSGMEVLYDDVEVLVLAPSVDLRNRYDSYGVDVNSASIVLRLRRGNGSAILGGDAHFDSWGKVCEEFPRVKHLTYPPVKKKKTWRLDEREPEHPDIAIESQADQLKCNLFKVAHHGSKHGTSFEYLEKMAGEHCSRELHYAITCGRDEDYQKRWKGRFPHPLTRLAIWETYRRMAQCADVPALDHAKVGLSSVHGSMVYTIKANGRVERADLGETMRRQVTADMLATALE